MVEGINHLILSFTSSDYRTSYNDTVKRVLLAQLQSNICKLKLGFFFFFFFFSKF